MKKTIGKDQSLSTIEEQLSWNQDKKVILEGLKIKFPDTDQGTLYRWISDVEKRMIKEGCKTERDKEQLKDREFRRDYKQYLEEQFYKANDIKLKMDIGEKRMKLGKHF